MILGNNNQQILLIDFHCSSTTKIVSVKKLQVTTNANNNLFCSKVDQPKQWKAEVSEAQHQMCSKSTQVIVTPTSNPMENLRDVVKG